MAGRRRQRVVGVAIDFCAHQDEPAFGVMFDDVRDDAALGITLVKFLYAFGDGDVILKPSGL